MNKELAKKIFACIETSITDKDLLKNYRLGEEIESLKKYLLHEDFSSASAKIHIDKLISQCPKFVRRHLYSFFISKHEQDSAIAKRKIMSKATEYSVTNISAPWQAGSPGSGKRS